MEKEVAQTNDKLFVHGTNSVLLFAMNTAYVATCVDLNRKFLCSLFIKKSMCPLAKLTRN